MTPDELIDVVIDARLRHCLERAMQTGEVDAKLGLPPPGWYADHQKSALKVPGLARVNALEIRAEATAILGALDRAGAINDQEPRMTIEGDKPTSLEHFSDAEIREEALRRFYRDKVTGRYYGRLTKQPWHLRLWARMQHGVWMWGSRR